VLCVKQGLTNTVFTTVPTNIVKSSYERCLDRRNGEANVPRHALHAPATSAKSPICGRNGLWMYACACAPATAAYGTSGRMAGSSELQPQTPKVGGPKCQSRGPSSAPKCPFTVSQRRAKEEGSDQKHKNNRIDVHVTPKEPSFRIPLFRSSFGGR